MSISYLEPKIFGTFPPSRLQSALMGVGRRLHPTAAGHRIASLIRSTLKRTSQGPVDAEVFGQKMRLHPFDNASEKRLLATPQFFDPVELEILSNAVTPGFMFVDIGANAGIYTLFVARRSGAKGHVLAVEPHPVVRARLQTNLALNGLKNVVIAPVALSDHNGEILLHTDGQNLGATSVHADWISGAKQSGIRVPASTLAMLLAQNQVTRVDAIKIDVEGAEDQVLAPFFNSAPSQLFPRLLIVEDSRLRWRVDLAALMQSKGYQVRATNSGNLIFMRCV